MQGWAAIEIRQHPLRPGTKKLENKFVYSENTQKNQEQEAEIASTGVGQKSTAYQMTRRDKKCRRNKKGQKHYLQNASNAFSWSETLEEIKGGIGKSAKPVRIKVCQLLHLFSPTVGQAAKAKISKMNRSTIAITLDLEHSYAEQLPDFFAEVWPTPVRDPELLQFNQSLACELGLDRKELSAEVTPQIFSGNKLPRDARPIAQAYAGHQFGNFVPQLGDGRAMLLGEVIDRHGMRRDIGLKGSGRTPFSRGGDGKAGVGPVLREYLISEAMHALGIPTTRALAAVSTGEPVMRERALPGAVLTRVAASHVRVGTFQYFAARHQFEHVRNLADYVIARHYPESFQDDQPYLSLLRNVVERQAILVARWMLVGFIHGVMNTDNMTISGETIDYGPCAFMDACDPLTVFSSIDRDGRYAYANQPAVALWNLTRLAETLLPLLDQDTNEQANADATAVLETFVPTFQQHWYEGAVAKLGITNPERPGSVSGSERALVDDWHQLLAKQAVDYTLAWRHLAEAAEGNADKLESLFAASTELDEWLKRWRTIQNGIASPPSASAIRSANPLYIPRNHLVEEAIAAASDDGDLRPFESLLKVVQAPFDEQSQYARYATPASPEFNTSYQTFCGT